MLLPARTFFKNENSVPGLESPGPGHFRETKAFEVSGKHTDGPKSAGKFSRCRIEAERFREECKHTDSVLN